MDRSVHRPLALAVVAVLVGLAACPPAGLVEVATGGPSGAWWRQAALGRDGLSIGAWTIASATGLLLVLSAASRLSRPRRAGALVRGVGRGPSEDGTAIIEFALLFPVAVVLFLLIVQAAFLYVGNFYVNLAAFRAARAAVVWAGVDGLPPDEQSTLAIGPEALRRMHAAAAATCVGISGTSVGDCPRSEAAIAQESAWRSLIGYGPAWSGDKLLARIDYAAGHTRVRARAASRPDPTLSVWNAQNADYYRNREPITVEVTHDFELAVPYARWIMGQEWAETGGMDLAPGCGPPTNSEYRYLELKAAYTMVREGQPELTPGSPAGADQEP